MGKDLKHVNCLAKFVNKLYCTGFIATNFVTDKKY